MDEVSITTAMRFKYNTYSSSGSPLETCFDFSFVLRGILWDGVEWRSGDSGWASDALRKNRNVGFVARELQYITYPNAGSSSANCFDFPLALLLLTGVWVNARSGELGSTSDALDHS